MNECLHNVFILNNEIKKRKDFNESYLYKGRSFYEVLRYFNGYCLFLEDHLERMENSLRLFNIGYKIENQIIYQSLLKLVSNNHVQYGNVKLVINFDKSLEDRPNVLAYFTKYKYPTLRQYKYGIDVSLLSIERRIPNAKFVNDEVLAAVKCELLVKGFYETLMVDRDDYITEGSKSNVFFLKSDRIYTPTANKVLPGITRKYVIKICNELNIKVIETNISINDLNKYKTVFISGTSAKILPVRRINDIYFKPNNKLLMQIIESYDNIIYEYLSRKNQYKMEFMNSFLS